MVIKSNGITLKSIEMSDTDRIVYWRNLEHVKQNFIYRQNFTVESHEKWMKTMVNTGKVVQFIIYDDETAVGSTYLRDIDRKNSKAEFGIFIGEKSSIGKGIGRQSAQLIVRYGFDELGLHKIFLRVLAENQMAIKSYIQAGFQKEAYLHDEVKIDSAYKDIILMAVINN